MATHDYVIDNSTGANVRADINLVLQAILTNNSSSSAPSTTAAYMWWADTTTGILKIRNSSNNDWVELLQLDGTLTLEDGSASTPALAFRDDLNTGIFSSAADTFNVATAGVERMEIGSTAIHLNDGGNDVDFIVEGSSQANLFHINAGDNTIGIRTATPDRLFTINASATTRMNIKSGSSSTTGIEFGDSDDFNAGFIVYDNSDNSLGFGVNGTGEKARIDSSGRLLIGTSTSKSTSAGQYGLLNIQGGAGTTENFVAFSRNEAASAMSADDEVSNLTFTDSVGYEFARIKVLADAATGTADTPGRLVFLTTPDGASAAQERLRIDSSGNLLNRGEYHLSDSGTIRGKILLNPSDTDDLIINAISLGSNIDFKTVDSQRMRLDSHGRILLRTTGVRSVGGHNALFHQEGADFHDATHTIVANSGDANGAYLMLAKQRSGGIGGGTRVQSEDEVGVIRFAAHDGNDFSHRLAEIKGMVDGTPGTDDLPGRLVFFTTPDGSTTSTERVRINNGGFFKAKGNSASYADGNGAYHEFVHNDGGQIILNLKNNSSNGFGMLLNFNHQSSTNYAFQVYDFANNSSRMIIRTDGDLENANNSYTGISDVKLKENIVDAQSQWDDIKALKVRNFNFKSDSSKTKMLGLVAQEAEAVCPSLIKSQPDLDQERNDLGTETKVLKYSILYMKAVKALQEAQTRIEVLETKVAALETA